MSYFNRQWRVSLIRCSSSVFYPHCFKKKKPLLKKCGPNIEIAFRLSCPPAASEWQNLSVQDLPQSPEHWAISALGATLGLGSDSKRFLIFNASDISIIHTSHTDLLSDSWKSWYGTFLISAVVKGLLPWDNLQLFWYIYLMTHIGNRGKINASYNEIFT